MHGVIIPPGQEEELFHQFFHGIRLALDSVNGLLTGGRVILAPAVEKVGIALYDRNRGTQLMTGVRDKAHLRAIGLINSVQHGVDGLGQRLQLFLSTGYRNTGIQVSGVNLIQLACQGLEFFWRHSGDRIERGRRCRQILNGPQDLFNGACIFKEIGNEA